MLARHRLAALVLLVLAGSCGGEEPDGSVEGEPCGGWGAGVCIAGLYCEFEGVCAEVDGVGTCKAPPRQCDRDAPSVCGCDGERYDNACEAVEAGEGNILIGGSCALEAEAGEPSGSVDPLDPA